MLLSRATGSYVLESEYAILILFCTAINYLSTPLLARMKVLQTAGLVAADLILSWRPVRIQYLGFASKPKPLIENQPRVSDTAV